MQRIGDKRKLIVSMNLTLDGFMSDIDCGLDWHFRFWNAEMAEALAEQLISADTILLGKTTYLAMAGHWSSREDDTGLPLEDRTFRHLMNSHKKIVFSGTIMKLPWMNSEKMAGNLENQISSLKKMAGGNILVYGSRQLTQSLISYGLVDEFHLWVHPVVLGHGKPLFRDQAEFSKLELTVSKTLRSSVVIRYYRRLV